MPIHTLPRTPARPGRRLVLAVAVAVLAVAAPMAATAAAAVTVRSIHVPVAGTFTYSDTYGACRGTDCERSHQGQDLMGAKMQILLAAVDGTVTRAGLGGALSGNYLVLRDADGWTYHYLHLNNDTPGTDDGSNPPGKVFGPGIAVGAKVRAGQIVGYMGDSGNAESTAPHLHFEIRDPKGVPINPYESLRRAIDRRFVDVPAGSWFDEPVWWMTERRITTGVGDTGRFEPQRAVTRAEWATFAWRAAGRPAPSGPQFPDVRSDAYYADAVRWLRATGVTTGVGDSGHFEPDRSITRAELVVMLHRLAGRPQAGTSSSFVDVPANSFYAAAVAWAVSEGHTTGVGGTGRFEPAGIVTRAQAATFLYRYHRSLG